MTVKGRNGTNHRQQAVLDTLDMRNQNLLYDLYILVKTARVVPWGSGSY